MLLSGSHAATTSTCHGLTREITSHIVITSIVVKFAFRILNWRRADVVIQYCASDYAFPKPSFGPSQWIILKLYCTLWWAMHRVVIQGTERLDVGSRFHWRVVVIFQPYSLREYSAVMTYCVKWLFWLTRVVWIRVLRTHEIHDSFVFEATV